MLERLTKNKEIDATVHDENNFNKTPAFKKEDVKQSLKGTIKLLENSIQECESEMDEGKIRCYVCSNKLIDNQKEK